MTPADRTRGWQRSTFGRFARVMNGADYSAVEVEEGGYPVYGSGGEFRRASKYLYDGESVLFGRKGTVDRPLYVDGRFWTVDTMFYTDIDRRALLPRFAYYWALTVPFKEWATDTALPSMTSGAIKAAPIALPPLTEQRAIAGDGAHRRVHREERGTRGARAGAPRGECPGCHMRGLGQ